MGNANSTTNSSVIPSSVNTTTYERPPNTDISKVRMTDTEVTVPPLQSSESSVSAASLCPMRWFGGASSNASPTGGTCPVSGRCIDYLHFSTMTKVL